MAFSETLKSILAANWWSLLEMDRHTSFLMMKAALAPTIVIAIAQIATVSRLMGAASHIGAVVAVTSHCLMHRGKFVRIMLFNLLALALAVCVACLALTTAVKAGRRYPRSNVSPKTGNGYEESRDFDLNPLEPYFVVCFEHMMHETFRRRRHFPGKLTSLALDEIKDKSANRDHSKTRRDIITSGSRIRLEFFMILYMGHMQDILLHTTHELIKFADSRVATGTLKSYRAILPKHDTLKKWFSLVQPEQSKLSESTSTDCHEIEEAHLPDSEHMTPENTWENSSHGFRLLCRAVISEHSLFGFRVAAASFSISILAFFHTTNAYFVRQRLDWIIVLIVIGMNPTTGETFFGLTSRIIGSAISVVLCLGIWYAVDENTTGIIILLYFANVIEYWFYVKRPPPLLTPTTNHEQESSRKQNSVKHDKKNINVERSKVK